MPAETYYSPLIQGLHDLNHSVNDWSLKLTGATEINPRTTYVKYTFFALFTVLVVIFVSRSLSRINNLLDTLTKPDLTFGTVMKDGF